MPFHKLLLHDKCIFSLHVLQFSVFFTYYRESTTLPGLLQSLVKKEIIQGDEYCVLEIRRSNVLKDGLKEARKSKFNHKKRLKVYMQRLLLNNRPHSNSICLTFYRFDLLVRGRLIMEVP